MQKTLFLILSIILISSFADDNDEKKALLLANPCQCEQWRFYTPDPVYVQGSANLKIKATQFIIVFSYETLHLNAAKSLALNNDVLKKVNDALKAQKFIKQLNISTPFFTIQPSFKYVVDQKTQIGSNVFEGYRVKQSLQIQSNSIDLAGEVIDIVITNGMTSVDSVQFLPQDLAVKNVKDQLIGLAVQDAQNKANLLLKPLKYKVQQIKSVQILSDNYYQPFYYQKNMALASRPQEDASTNLEADLSSYTLSVQVSFIIVQV